MRRLNVRRELVLDDSPTRADHGSGFVWRSVPASLPSSAVSATVYGRKLALKNKSKQCIIFKFLALIPGDFNTGRVRHK